ncbi:MAG: response regulator [Phycisphaerales bacterium]|nr:response regulator [Phycisphaerales bacterium]
MTDFATESAAASNALSLSTDIDLEELRGASILLVDDNLQNLELMQAYLETLPCRIRTASDGLDAVREIERDPPDLVLLDVMMPRMSGFEVCQKIKGNPRTRDIVVIMVTALHEVGDYERAHESGTDDFLTKPVNKLELLIRVKSLLRVRLLKRQLEALRKQLAGDHAGLDDAMEIEED